MANYVLTKKINFYVIAIPLASGYHLFLEQVTNAKLTTEIDLAYKYFTKDDAIIASQNSDLFKVPGAVEVLEVTISTQAKTL